jgi:hypothetical protein
MKGLLHSDVGRAVFLVVTLSLAALVVRPLALPLAAQVGATGTVVADGTAKTGLGVLPSKKVPQLASKPRHWGPWLESPPSKLEAVEAWRVSGCAIEPMEGSEFWLWPEASLGAAHRPRGPPSASSQANATGSRQPAGAFRPIGVRLALHPSVSP